uniref:Integrase catalytic domain-containing protein n=1 Tax=Tanacetum cinerariifolium TaxID=118510 RepID=A0A699HHQ4_TANCI|nr:hypothetical protein [Tanacetum cinerariifolium]
MNQFYEKKGIKREFSVARTPQQNGVAERKNRTLIEATRTMLADLKFPTTFWAEAVKTACYVQNRANEGFFVGYSMNSKAFRVFNSRTRIVEETLHITFIENKPNVAGSGPTWIFDIDTLTKFMNYKPVVAGDQSNGSADKDRVETVPDKDYILLPLWTQDPLFSSSSKDSLGDGFKPSREEEKKDAKDLRNKDNKEPRVSQEKDSNVNITNNINTVSLTANVVGIKDNVVDKDIVYGCADDPNMPNLEEIVYSDDDEDVGAEADMTTLVTNIPVRLEDPEFLNRVYKIEKALYGLHQALRAWKEICTEFEKMMNKKFQMSSMGEFTFFLGLQVTQKDEGIFISQDKYVHEILKNFGLSSVKTASLPMETSKHLLKDENAEDDSPFDLEAYTDSDYAAASLDRKSTIRGCQFLGSRFISWHCKKPTIFANYTTEAEYVAASNCYGHNEVKQLLRMKFRLTLLYCENLENVKTDRVICEKKEMRDVVTSKTERELMRIKIDDGNAFWNEIKVKLVSQKLPLELQLLRVYLIYKKETSCIVNADFVEIVDFLNANPIRQGKDFSGRVTLLFETMLIQHLAEMGKSSGQPTEPQHTPTTASPSHIIPIPNKTVYKDRGDKVERAATTAASLEWDRPAQTRSERLSKQSHEPPLSRVNTLRSGEDSMQLMELMKLCTQLFDRFLALENNMTAQDLEITHLKKRVKRMEKKRKSRTPQLKIRLFKVRIESSTEKSLDDLEDSSKQGRKITEIDQDPGISLVQHDEIQGRYGHDTEINATSTSITTTGINITTGEPITTISAPITTTGVSVSIAEPSTLPTTRTTVIEDEDLTIAQTLMKMRSKKSKEKAKEKGSKEKSSETATRPTRGVIMRKDQDKAAARTRKTFFEATIRLQAELDKEERQRIAMVHESDSSFNVEEWEDIQARVKANEELLQRAEARRNKTPIQAQQRTYMFNYIKNIKESKVDRVVLELAAGSSKGDVEEALDQGGSKRQKTENGIDIYMLVEKEYPYSRGTLTLVLVAKLLVDENNEMSRELLRKIFMQAERPRR